MFSRSDFWIGLAVGTLAGAFGYKMMSEQSMRAQQAQLPAQPAAAQAGGISLEELIRQKEQLEDMIAEQQQGQTA